jgi:hypothetical protein
MRILISGTGRGGTNLLTELVKKITDVNFTQDVEDREFFSRTLYDNYGTKLATDHSTFTLENLRLKMKRYDDLHVIFSVRNPIDNCLSKIVRGRPASAGGDKVTENTSSDGTPATATTALKQLYSILTEIKELYPHRVHVVRMEDVVSDTQKQVTSLAAFLNIEPQSYEGFQQNNRNRYQKKRYGDKLAPQVNLYKDLKNNFEGYFVDKTDIVCYIEEELISEIKEYY